MMFKNLHLVEPTETMPEGAVLVTVKAFNEKKDDGSLLHIKRGELYYMKSCALVPGLYGAQYMFDLAKKGENKPSLVQVNLSHVRTYFRWISGGA